MHASVPFDFAKIGEQSAALLQQFSEQHKDTDFSSLAHITDAFMQLSQKMMAEPEKLVEAQLQLYQSYLALWASMAERMMGKESAPVAMPEKGDRRFSAPEWSEHLIFDYLKQSYLLSANWVTGLIAETKGLDVDTKMKVSFYTRQWLDALSPSNFPHTNPEVLNKIVETKGENLVKGLQNMLKDMERGGGKLKISMTDYDAFEVGKNLATTPGKVVFENRMFQLIQYTPQTKQVFEKPLLIFPPWINKFYILDLQEKNSFVRYCVEQCGLQVFMVSWKNPDETYRDVSFETYMQEGICEAIDHTLAITKEKSVNAIGYCIGGTLLAASLAVMAKKKDKRVNSATFFTTLIDFTDAGELKVFIDEPQVQQLEKKMADKGYLDGKEMAATFSMLRANDLIWSFVVNNYLLGNDPFPFDLLYWNDDPTRMPAKMHSYYLRNMYLENNLAKKDKLTLLGEKVDVSLIEQPIYMVSAINDHITPWTSCFAPMHKMKGDITFVLGKAGHVAGVVNPPSSGKGMFWEAKVGDKDNNPEKWLKTAKQHDGTWWTGWQKWITKQSGKQKAAPKTFGDAQHKPIENAPGRYVKEKS